MKTHDWNEHLGETVKQYNVYRWSLCCKSAPR